MVTGRAVFCSSKKRQIQSVVFLTVLYRTAEWDVPGKGFHAAADKLALLAGASSFVHVLLWRIHHKPVGLWHGWDQRFSKCEEHLPGGGARELPGRPFMKTRYSRNYHLGGPRIRINSCLVNRPKVRRGRKSLFHCHSVSFAMRCLWMIVRPSKRRSGGESNHPCLVAKPVEPSI